MGWVLLFTFAILLMKVGCFSVWSRRRTKYSTFLFWSEGCLVWRWHLSLLGTIAPLESFFTTYQAQWSQCRCISSKSKSKWKFLLYCLVFVFFSPPLILGPSSGSGFCPGSSTVSAFLLSSKTSPLLSLSTRLAIHNDNRRQSYLPLHPCVTNLLVCKHKANRYLLLPPSDVEEDYVITLPGATPHRHTNWRISHGTPDNISRHTGWRTLG